MTISGVVHSINRFEEEYKTRIFPNAELVLSVGTEQYPSFITISVRTSNLPQLEGVGDGDKVSVDVGMGSRNPYISKKSGEEIYWNNIQLIRIEKA